MLPVLLVTSPGEAIGSAWSESSRNRALMLGLPALIVAFVAVSAIAGVQLLSQSSLEDKYDYLYQKTTADLIQLSKEIARNQQVQKIDAATAKPTISEEEKAQLIELRQAQQIYLDKLIALDPENNEYRFELAKLVSSRGNRDHAFNILRELAPEDIPGFPKAHSVLARHYFDLPARPGMERDGNLAIAEKHVNHVLTRDEKDTDAMKLKARILTRLRQYEGAHKLYTDLFEDDPNYFRELAELNRELDQTERDRALYERALAQFEQQADQDDRDGNDRDWIRVEAGIATTLQKLERYPEAEARLDRLIQKYAADPKGGPRRVFLQHLIADTYIIWANSIADTKTSYESLDEETLNKLLDLYTKAYRNKQDNVLVLQSLARLSLASNEVIAEKARTVYDPNADVEAPSAVLNQLGNHALLNKRFSEAIMYYERAREKAPRDPAVLNNLAYSYLVAQDDERNAERALQLINEAIKNIPAGFDPYEASKFLHTKATALKQQDRLQEALAVYERALKSRPDHADTLRSLIECYRGLNKPPPEQYSERLAELEEEMRRNQPAAP